MFEICEGFITIHDQYVVILVNKSLLKGNSNDTEFSASFLKALIIISFKMLKKKTLHTDFTI